MWSLVFTFIELWTQLPGNIDTQVFLTFRTSREDPIGVKMKKDILTRYEIFFGGSKKEVSERLTSITY